MTSTNFKVLIVGGKFGREALSRLSHWKPEQEIVACIWQLA